MPATEKSRSRAISEILVRPSHRSRTPAPTAGSSLAVTRPRFFKSTITVVLTKQSAESDFLWRKASITAKGLNGKTMVRIEETRTGNSCTDDVASSGDPLHGKLAAM